jgi:uncharacterized membrane protein SpoIIM required for sporulation
MAIILSNQWLAKRRPYWDRLSWLLNQAAQGGVRRLSRAELRETALLYRQAASDLSTLRQDATARAYTELVNQLLARAHHIIYSSRRKGFGKIFYFLRDEYPALVQRQFRYVLVSLIILLAGGALGAVLTLARPQFMRHMLGPAMIDTIEHHKMWTESIVAAAPAESSALMTHNLTVCFGAFAGGIVFGLGPVWFMFLNGLLLGVIGVACQQHGMALDLWSFVAPHGSLELPSIVLSGAAGLRLGRGVVFPGLYRWRDSIALAGVEATRMVAGIIPLLIIAGSLEGFFSPFDAKPWLKFSVGGLLFSLLLVWLFRPVRAATTPRDKGDPKALPVQWSWLLAFEACFLFLAFSISIIRTVVGITRHNLAATITYAVMGTLIGIVEFKVIKKAFRHKNGHRPPGDKRE